MTLPAPPLVDPYPTATLLWLPDGGSSVLPPVSEVGGKAHNLGRLVAAGMRVPPFFALRSSAFARLAGEADAAAIGGLALPADLRDALADALARICGDGAAVAVRSSAVGEDGERSSFAGQFQTVLAVAPEADAVWDAVRRVWASAFTAHAEEYRRERGEESGGMAVVVQRMVESAAAGVAFSVDPVSGDRGVAVVSAVPGLGEGLVSGALDADTFHVRFNGGPPAVSARVVPKESAFRSAADGGVHAVPVGEAERHAAVLSDDEARRVAEAARALAERLDAPQDVEWALAEGPEGARTLWLLQTRPVTALPDAPPAPVGDRRVWDNENIVESYPGVTLPLSYSVARRVFGEVYLQIAENMAVAPDVLRELDDDIRNLFGLIRGRVYYNAERRARILAAVAAAAEADENGAMPPAGALPAPLLLASRALGVPPRALRETARVEDEVTAFRERVARELEPLVAADFAGRTPDELVRTLRRIDREVVRRWHGPMLNDGLVEFWMELLTGMGRMWLPGMAAGLLNRLVAGDGTIVSTEPVRRLAELGARAGADPALAALLRDEHDDDRAWERLTGDPAFAQFGAELRGYLARFGDRCVDELKLEARSLDEEPAMLVRMLRRYAAAPRTAARADAGAELRAAAEAEVRAKLAPGHQVAFFAVLERVRRMTRDRENLRFERTRVFGVMRRIYRELGAQLAARGALADPRDIFYLGEDEVADYLEGCAPANDLRARVAQRRAEFAGYAELPDPPARLVTHGPPALSALEEAEEVVNGPPLPRVDGMLRGLGCCPGLVRAPVRVVHDPRDAGDLAGHILVARQTDPGWTLLFPAAAGVLVQRGSILSHAALVAREMGIACIVGIPDLLSTLKDGDVVEMDGASGIVRRIDAAA